MKKILFVSPPRWNEIRYPLMDFIGGVVWFPPIGMMYISAYLKMHGKVQTEFFDYNLLPDQNYGTIDPILSSFKPDIVGISSFTSCLYDIYEVCRHVRRRLPDAKIVLGGKHVELYPHETLAHDFIDYLILGEGESPMLELVAALEAGEEAPTIPGVWCKKDGTVIDGGRAPRFLNIDDLPLPDYSIFQTGLYSYAFDAEGPEAILVTTRGCPFSCSYCTSAHSSRVFVTRSAAGIVAEFRARRADGFSKVTVFDDCFNANLPHAKEVCRQLGSANLPITWTVRCVPELFDEEFADLLKTSRCDRVAIGIESANEDVLATFGRNSSNEQIRRTLSMVSSRGIATQGYFMLGFPGEDRAMVKRTMDFAESLPLDFAQFFPIYPLPGTQFFKDLVARGLMKEIYREHTVNPPRVRMFPYYEDRLTTSEISDLLRIAYKRFYMRPVIVARHARRLKSPMEFYRKARMAVSLMRHTALDRQR